MNGKIEFHGVSSLPGAHDLWLNLISGVDGSLFLSFLKKIKYLWLKKKTGLLPFKLLMELPSNQITIHNPLNI